MQASLRSQVSQQSENFPDVDFAMEQQAIGFQAGPGDTATPGLKTSQPRSSRALNLLIEQSVELKRRIMELRKEKGLRAVAFASANRGVGVASVIMNLVKTFEKTEALRVLVIDANFKSPGVSNYLGSRGLGKGLLDLLEEPEASDGVLQKTRGSSLYFMPHGRKRRNPAQLLTRDRVVPMLRSMESLFDLIFIDAPPLRDFPDGFLWGRIADGMILVSHPQRTTMEDVRFVQAAAKQHKIEMLGNVLNRRRCIVPHFVYEWF